MEKKTKTEVDVFTADYREDGQRNAPSPVKPRPEAGGQGKAAPVESPPEAPEEAREEAPEEVLEAAQDEELDDFLPVGESLRDGVPEDSPRAALVQPRAQRRRGTRRYGVALGAFVLALALVGVCAIATLAGRQIYQAATDDSALRAYDSFLAPVVMQDPEPFESPEKADPEFVQNAALWQTILADNGASYTEYDDAGRALIPVGDVSAACSMLFGPDCRLSPRTPEDNFYSYDEETEQYHVALFSSESAYEPYTESARSENGDTVLRVAYVTPGSVDHDGSSADSAQQAHKRMDYVLRTNEATGEQYVYAVREITE